MMYFYHKHTQRLLINNTSVTYGTGVEWFQVQQLPLISFKNQFSFFIYENRQVNSLTLELI